MRAAMYRDERAAMRAAARAGHLVEINSLLRFIASHDPEATAPRVAPHLKNGRVHDLPGWNHGFLDAKTAETATIVRQFLNS